MENPDSEINARIVKGRIERATLGDLCSYFKEVYDPSNGCFISVKVDMNTIKKLQLELTIDDVKACLLNHKNLGGIRLQASDITVVPGDKLRVRPPQRTSTGDKRQMVYFTLQQLKAALPRAVVHGVKSTKRAVIYEEEKQSKNAKRGVYILVVEGTGLQEVIGIKGIDPTKTTSNHVIEVEKVLGIEAARSTIMGK